MSNVQSLHKANVSAFKIKVSGHEKNYQIESIYYLLNEFFFLIFKGELAPHTFLEIPKNLNRGLFGASIFLCYKKAWISAPQIKYLPSNTNFNVNISTKYIKDYN